MSKIYAATFVAVVFIDALCMTFVFPIIFRLNGRPAVQISFLPAVFIALVSAVSIGILLLEFGGRGSLIYANA